MIALPDNLTAAQLAQLKDAVEAEEARRHLLPFIKRMKEDYQPGPHHWLLCELMELMDAGVIRRLITEMPPRHGKSAIVSHFYPAWYLGRHPERQFIGISYGQPLANDFSRWARDCFKHEKWPFDAKLHDSAYAVERWMTSKGGVYTAAGRQASITGRGAHHLNVDDPYKDREEAMSDLIKEEVWSKFTGVARTRMMPGGTIALTQTRWTDDDVAGRLQKQAGEGAGQWFCVKLPALHEAAEVWADVTVPDDLAREAGIKQGEGISMHELVGRLHALKGGR